MRTLEILREEGLRSALRYVAVSGAKRHPGLARAVARFYCDGCCKPIRISHENGSIRALPDYTGRLVIFEVN
ncbi:MAG: hypothetical protein ABIH92_00605 [Nanoarchaeota archaeon]